MRKNRVSQHKQEQLLKLFPATQCAGKVGIKAKIITV